MGDTVVCSPFPSYLHCRCPTTLSLLFHSLCLLTLPPLPSALFVPRLPSPSPSLFYLPYLTSSSLPSHFLPVSFLQDMSSLIDDAPKEFLDPILDSLMRYHGSDSTIASHISTVSLQYFHPSVPSSLRSCRYRHSLSDTHPSD